MILRFDGIHVRIGGKEIVKGADLCTEEGRVTGIIGPNGWGKSTLIKTAISFSQETGVSDRLCRSGSRLRI